MRDRLRSLDPSLFSLVMATGIVAVAARAEGVGPLAEPLLWLNVACYAGLCAAFLARLALFPRAHLDDLRSHRRAMGYFTLPAGTAVLGMDALVIGGSPGTARILWFVAGVLWVLCVYAVPMALVTRRDKPSLDQGLSGTWLVWVVATQATSVLGTRVAGTFGAAADDVLLLTTVLWLVGGMFYLWIIQLIIRRLLFGPAPDDLSPTHWIDMGALAVSALAGATLLQVPGASPLIQTLRPFVAGLTLVFWGTATWWIPWLVLFGLWRYAIERRPAAFEVGLWGLVFPLGMYTVATRATSGALQLPALATVAAGFVWVAVVAWAATMLDLLLTGLRHRRPR